MLGMIVEIQREKTKPFEKIVLVLQRIRKLYSYASNITANLPDAWKEMLEEDGRQKQYHIHYNIHRIQCKSFHLYRALAIFFHSKKENKEQVTWKGGVAKK